MTLKEQIENKCKNFTGIQNKTCEAGIAYDDVRDPNSRPFKWPCFKTGVMSGGVCDLACFPSPEEIEAELKEIRDIIRQTC